MGILFTTNVGDGARPEAGSFGLGFWRWEDEKSILGRRIVSWYSAASDSDEKVAGIFDAEGRVGSGS